MDRSTREVAAHMREYGLSVLGRATCYVVFNEMSRPYAHAMAVTLAAHGAEILVKARIAEEHPLLIFSSLPKSNTTQEMLSYKELATHGRTFMFSELPERLWAATGYRMGNAEHFLKFGELRNQIMHFAVPAVDLAATTLRFLFEVIEPMAEDFWKESLVESATEHDDPVASDGYLEEQLERAGEIGPALRARIDATKREYELPKFEFPKKGPAPAKRAGPPLQSTATSSPARTSKRRGR